MAQNTNPVFSLVPNIGMIQSALTANTGTDITAGTIYLCFTAGANGSWVDFMDIKPLGTNVASFFRFWVNNGSATGTLANSNYVKDWANPSTVAANTNPQPQGPMPWRLALPPGWRIYATLPTGVAAGFDITTYGGDF